MTTKPPAGLVETVFDGSRSVDPRSRYEVFTYLSEEVGELATEVSIKEGYSQKESGDDGITGEACDVIICALDLIYLEYPDITEAEIIEILANKVAKWKNKSD